MLNVPSETERSRIKQLEAQLALTRREINNLRHQLRSLSFIHKKECQDIKEKLENWRCLGCRNNPDVNTEDAQGAGKDCSESLVLDAIGTIYTDFPEKRGTPRQSSICESSTAKLTLNGLVFTNPNHALEGLQDFSHMWILFYFHKNDSTHVNAKVSPPRLNGAKMGVFATRSPHRPNPIGLSLVKIDKIVANDVYFSGVDMVNGTPAFDIKPYIPQYDNPFSIYLPELYCTKQSPSLPDIPSRNVSDDARFVDGEEPIKTNHLAFKTSTPEKSDSGTMVDELYPRIGERESPEGEEDAEEPSIFTPINNNSSIEALEGVVRVPSWIHDSPVSTLTVTFKERALHQLRQLGNEGEEKKNIISNILREDPRSTYLRQRWGSHCYVFRISDLYVSCKFNDTSHAVVVFQVFQNDIGDNESLQK